MTDHKFEPFQQVLVRDFDTSPWRADFFSHQNTGDKYMYVTTTCGYAQCIPYTPETAHLLGTSQPYEPPKPPQEYEWGQKVDVLWMGKWSKGVFIRDDGSDPTPTLVVVEGFNDLAWVERCEIRPIPDDTAAHADD